MHKPSTKKLRGFRSEHFSGPKRKKPKVQRLNQEVKDRILAENDVVQALIRDASVRRQLWSNSIAPLAPLTVWTDSAHSEDYTEVWRQKLPKWRDIGEYLKIHLLFQVALEFGAYSFTARIRPDLEARWYGQGTDIAKRIRTLLWDNLKLQKLDDVEFFYLIEGKGRRGKGKTPLHLHGFLVAEEPLVATRFKIALEMAVAAHPKGKAAAGFSPKSGKAIDFDLAYDVDTGDGRGYGRWVQYITKSGTKHDKRLGYRHIYMSQTATQLVREFWALIREDPMPGSP